MSNTILPASCLGVNDSGQAQPYEAPILQYDPSVLAFDPGPVPNASAVTCAYIQAQCHQMTRRDLVESWIAAFPDFKNDLLDAAFWWVQYERGRDIEQELPVPGNLQEATHV